MSAGAFLLVDRAVPSEYDCSFLCSAEMETNQVFIACYVFKLRSSLPPVTAVQLVPSVTGSLDFSAFQHRDKGLQLFLCLLQPHFCGFYVNCGDFPNFRINKTDDFFINTKGAHSIFYYKH
jgi:hypothetical protein